MVAEVDRLGVDKPTVLGASQMMSGELDGEDVHVIGTHKGFFIRKGHIIPGEPDRRYESGETINLDDGTLLTARIAGQPYTYNPQDFSG